MTMASRVVRVHVDDVEPHCDCYLWALRSEAESMPNGMTWNGDMLCQCGRQWMAHWNDDGSTDLRCILPNRPREGWKIDWDDMWHYAEIKAGKIAHG